MAIVTRGPNQKLPLYRTEQDVEEDKPMARKRKVVDPIIARALEKTFEPDGPVSDIERGQLESLLDAACSHGQQSERDHEAGDLADILRSCWNVMSPAQRERVFTEHQSLIADWSDK